MKYRSHIVPEWLRAVCDLSPTVREPMTYTAKESSYPIPSFLPAVMEPCSDAAKYGLRIVPPVAKPLPYSTKEARNAAPGFRPTIMEPLAYPAPDILYIYPNAMKPVTYTTPYVLNILYNIPMLLL